ncbi:MAG TPA: class I SAM-dependent methyltransferase [Candidatus Binatus sp.]|nr:class I SAM-dependent methyltransferase [Candidatus Binatus sp.]
MPIEPLADALARLYDLDLSEHPGDVELYLALAARTGDPIVELAAGTGRVAVPLAVAGHHVVGIDVDEAMLTRARRRATIAEGRAPGTEARLRWLVADARRPLPSSSGMDAPGRLAILALNSLFVFAERAEQAAVIARMADLVGPGGTVVVDTWQPQPLDLVRMDGRVSLEWLREDPATGRLVTKQASAWYDPSTRVATVTTIFEEGGQGDPSARWTRVDRLRLATADELVEWAEDAGLQVERLAGDYDLAPYGPASERAILVAQAPG